MSAPMVPADSNHSMKCTYYANDESDLQKMKLKLESQGIKVTVHHENLTLEWSEYCSDPEAF